MQWVFGGRKVLRRGSFEKALSRRQKHNFSRVRPPWRVPYFQKNPRVRKIRVRNSGARNGCANFMDAWEKMRSFCRKTSTSIKFLLLKRGGGILVFGGGGVECRFYFHGRADFSDTCFAWKQQKNYAFAWLLLSFRAFVVASRRFLHARDQRAADLWWEILWKLARVLDSWPLKPSCNLLWFPAMCPKTAFFCRKMLFLQENAFFCRKVHFSVRNCIFL